MKQKLKDKKIYAIYTALFIFITCIVFSIFFINKRTFIWQEDGLRQHYIILKNFNEIVRNFLSSPQNGIQLFSWNMGIGLDVIGQYSYYILGDPFAYISLLFPMENIETAYNFLVLLRLFFIGISFIAYGKYNNNKDKSILLGAIIYTFCSFSLSSYITSITQRILLPFPINLMIHIPQ